MARRFSLRPIIRRLSSKSPSVQSERSNVSAATSASSAIPSPPLPGCTPLQHKEEFPQELVERARSISASDAESRQNAPTIASASESLSIVEEPQQLKLDVHALPAVNNPQVVVEEPTPEAIADGDHHNHRSPDSIQQQSVLRNITPPSPLHTSLSISAQKSIDLSPGDDIRRQSLVGSANADIVQTLIDRPALSATNSAPTTTGGLDYLSPSFPDMATMLTRKIWVKRPNASATLVQINEDDLVDDVRDMILRKYANSLGKTFDSPDLTLTIVTRPDHAGPRSSRILGPEEAMCRTIDTYYPGGQTVEEALVIDLPQRRTPKPSPRAILQNYHAFDDFRPQENGNDYFPPMPATIQPTLPPSREHHHSIAAHDQPRSISVLNTGLVPALPSPSGRVRGHRAEREHRPKYGRQHTSSPTIITHSTNPGTIAAPLPASHITHRGSTRPRQDSSTTEAPHANGIPAAPPLPTPPAPEAPPTAQTSSTPPIPGAAPISHGHRGSRPRRFRKPTPDTPLSKSRQSSHPDTNHPNGSLLMSSVLDGSVPPINVLIVEDNIINLRILEGLMKRLKVRWQTAMNGQIAVDKWRTGGYHLVLMDIQMPVMNGLQATREIRRLERVNKIGVFSSTPGVSEENGPSINGSQSEDKPHDPENDKLSKSDGLFKSPIIIVALTASSLQSDRHEALAAGCNDFLTKPVNFVWLERKVKEWGCMQALIDFDGWRKWKDFAAKEEAGKSEEQKQKDREQEEKQKIRAEKLAKLQEKQRQKAEAEAKEKERKKRESVGEGSSQAQAQSPKLAPETMAEEPSATAV